MKMLLLGDVCPTYCNEMFDKKDTDSLFSVGVKGLFKRNEVNMVNLECALTDCETTIEKFGPHLKATASTADVLKEIGVNYCGLSNNHIFDYGKKGALDTIQQLERVGIVHTGFGMNYEESRKNLVIKNEKESVCIITVCEHEYSYALDDRMGSRPFDVFDTIEDVREASTQYDRVIVCYHGGKEFCPYPSPRLQKVCRAMAHNGADVILCQHSHCIGCYEQYEGCHIVYGQGNFHFSREGFTREWDESLSVEYDSISHEIQFHPTVLKNHCAMLAENDEKDNILAAFQKRNQELENGEWRTGWHNYCLTVQELYTGIIERVCAPNAKQRENDVLGHYMDCEAHSDVLFELFPTANKKNER